jgi:DnaJ-class molecular chaperone
MVKLIQKPKALYSEEECPMCEGKGTQVPDCETCDGKGKVRIDSMWEDCPDCLNQPCEMCGGRRIARRRF